MTDQKWSVGRGVVIEHAQYQHRHGQPYEPRLSYGTVIKVARKYFTVEITEQRQRYGGEETYLRTWTDEFEIATGIQRGDPNYTNYRDHAYTAQEWESESYRRRVNERIHEDHKVYSNSLGTMRFHDWSNAHLVELLDLLDRVKADNEMKDLDS